MSWAVWSLPGFSLQFSVLGFQLKRDTVAFQPLHLGLSQALLDRGPGFFASPTLTPAK